MIKTSIIIPIYNAEETLVKCVDSLLRQTTSSYEIILVDDCSTDDSYNICNNYNHLDFVRVFHFEKNSGVSAARNKGLEEAKGEYILFIDCDDWVKEDYLANLLTNSNSSSSELTMTGLIDYYTEQKNTPIKLERKTYSLKQKDDYYSFLNVSLLPSPVGKLFKKSIIKQHGLRFSIDISFAEDKEFVIKYLQYVNIVTVLDYAGYYYRRNTINSLSKKVHLKRYEAEYRIWEIRYNDYIARNICSKDSLAFYINELYFIIDDSIIYSVMNKIPFPKYNKKHISLLKRNKDLLKDKRFISRFLITNNHIIVLYQLYKLLTFIKR